MTSARLGALAAVATSVVFACTAVAEEAGPSPQVAEAYGIVVERLGKNLSHDEIAKLSILAHATAASLACDNLTLDEEALKSALNTPADDEGKMSNDEKLHHFNFTLVAFGALSGLMVDEATSDKAKFCKIATEDSSKPEAGNLLKIKTTLDQK